MNKVNPADEILNGNDNKTVVGNIVYPQIFGKSITDVVDICSQIVNIKKEQGEEVQPTNQTDTLIQINRTVLPPVDILKARTLKDISPHHASCIQSKKYSTMGLGFVSDASEIEESKNKVPGSVQDTENKVQSLLTGEAFIESNVDKTLDPLTLLGFMMELYKVVEDFLDGGTGYLEVIRDRQDKIIGLNWLPYENLVAVNIRDKDGRSRLVYKYSPGIGTGYGIDSTLGIGASLYGGALTRWYSLFGIQNRKWVWDNLYDTEKTGQLFSDDKPTTVNQSGLDITKVSEVIPFMLPSNRSRYYGYPEWLSAASFVSMLSMAMQYKSDFFTNRGVLAYILSIAGPVSQDKWKEINNLVQGGVGGGNNWKNLAINISDPKAKVRVDKLAADDKTEEQFAKDSEAFAQNIVSGHRVPPVLANILIPGKLGAANESVQALVSFQLLTVGPYQHMIQKTLARTLGGDEGIEDLDPEDFRLRTITSQFDITGLDTIGRAREEAVGSDRDFSQGVKKSRLTLIKELIKSMT